MSYSTNLDLIANAIESVIVNDHQGQEVETQDFGWSNKRFIGPKYRLAHIERYSDKSLEVLHVTCFPKADYEHGIFGFDIITTEKKPLAAFMDWSPIANSKVCDKIEGFQQIYPLPDWAKLIFSSNALAIIPNDEELVTLQSIVVESFTNYMLDLSMLSEDLSKTNQIILDQNRYCENQQKNERTFNVLKAKLGVDRAKLFMSEILFPLV